MKIVEVIVNKVQNLVRVQIQGISGYLADVTSANALKTSSSVTSLPTLTASVTVTSSALPAGAATAALQTTGNASLVQIDANTDPLVTSGGGGYIRQDSTATIAKESGGHLEEAADHLHSIDGKLVSGTDIGDVTINNASGVNAVNIQDGGNTITVDGTVAVNVITGFALETGGNLDTIAGDTTSIDGKITTCNTGAIAGTVTANAGTNLNTSALALETGGHLEEAADHLHSIDGKITACDTGAVVVSSGTVNVGTVTTLPAITGVVTANAGTNLNTSALLTTTSFTDKVNGTVGDDTAAPAQYSVKGWLSAILTKLGSVVASVTGTVAVSSVPAVTIAAGQKVQLTDTTTDVGVVAAPVGGLKVAVVDAAGAQITAFTTAWSNSNKVKVTDGTDDLAIDGSGFVTANINGAVTVNDGVKVDCNSSKVDCNGSSVAATCSGTLAVTTMKPDGSNTMPSLDAVLRPGYVREVVSGRNKTYKDASFVTGDSPVTIDVNTGLGRNGTEGYIDNYGTGILQVEISDNGADWGDAITLQAGVCLDLTKWNVDTIKLTWVSNTSYEVVVL